MKQSKCSQQDSKRMKWDTTGEDCCPQCKAVGIAIFLCFMLSHSVSYVADNARPLGRHPGLSTY
ncbi:hypothetical protein GBAR_LOCUS30877 [Geodia barretti]|uniref:Uncharacterized protein n=1 Tax=Geodia barretti TaxID=519541 RepID=A0AA35TZ83_GEOBA|nr:hypothetical protein GBAR_LOCUS30877 [Geodia barretti]